MSEHPWLLDQGDHLRLEVLVAPRASRERIMGVHDSRLKIQLTAPPVDGKANSALLRFLSTTLKVPKAQLGIATGHSSRRKSVQILGVPLKQALLALAPRSPEE